MNGVIRQLDIQARLVLPLEGRGLRRIGALAVALWTAATVLGLYAIHGGMRFNPIRLPFEGRIFAPLWIPEGWAFFTRDPREADLYVFTRQPNGWVNASLGPIAKPSNIFGLNRATRHQGVESSLLIGRLQKSTWRDCSVEPLECLDSAPVQATVSNQSSQRTLCGSVGFVLQKPVPWAWSRSRRKTIMPSQVVKLEITC